MLHDINIRHPIAISLGAIAGALSPYYFTLWFAQKLGTQFPFDTLFINLTGCLLMVFFFTLILEKIIIISPEISLMVTTEFLGAYTTFSTYELDTVILFRYRHFNLATFS